MAGDNTDRLIQLLIGPVGGVDDFAGDKPFRGIENALLGHASRSGKHCANTLVPGYDIGNRQGQRVDVE
ncbi:hypothetical protein CH267_07860 [Rhodococcus sp. 06-621-2]|nr:hypothetical protein CH267_07860 [Rhodococcus sp. 06-621-2]